MKTRIILLGLFITYGMSVYSQGVEEFVISPWEEEDEFGALNMVTEQSQLQVLSKRSKQNDQTKVIAPMTTKEGIKLSFSWSDPQ